MSDAKLILLPSDYVRVWISNSKWKLEPVMQEAFDLGFSEENFSVNPPVIQGLDLESRSAKAGLQDGDGITLKYGFLVDADVWPKLFTVYIKRGSEDALRKITWWPRSWHKVQSYQFV
jgi:hypothetical protein